MPARRRRVAILGSTGSIGVQALEVIDALNADAIAGGGGDAFEVVALVAHRNGELLAQQARRYRPKFIGLTDKPAAAAHRELRRGHLHRG